MRTAARRALARCASQVGKTYAGARKMDVWCIANPGQVFGCMVADLHNHYPEISAKIAAVATLPALDPACKYVEGKGWYTHGKPMLLYANGTRVLFRSGTSHLQALEGFSAGAGWIDEVPQRAHYGAFTRGVHGPLWLTTTPIGRDPAWLRERVEGTADAPPDEDWAQFVAPLSVEECPWLHPWQVAERIAKTDPYERPQRIYAEWEGPTEGRRFISYDDGSRVSMARALELLGSSWRAVVTADHGEGIGREHWLVIAESPSASVVLGEWVNDAMTIPVEDAPAILAMLARVGVPLARVARWVGDVNSAGKADVGKSVNRLYEEAFAAALTARSCPWRIESARKGAGSVEEGERAVNLAALERDGAWFVSATEPIRVLDSGLDVGADGWLRGHVAFRYEGERPLVWYVGAVPDRSGAVGVATTLQCLAGDHGISPALLAQAGGLQPQVQKRKHVT